MKPAFYRNVGSTLWVRRLASIAVAIGLATSSLGAIPAGQAKEVCPLAQHDCDKATFQDGCCPTGAPSTPAGSVFAEAWTTVVKAQYWATDWVAAIAGISEVAGGVPTWTGSFAPTGPPRPDHADCLTALLI
jgi:hypothetical protein